MSQARSSQPAKRSDSKTPQPGFPSMVVLHLKAAGSLSQTTVVARQETLQFLPYRPSAGRLASDTAYRSPCSRYPTV